MWTPSKHMKTLLSMRINFPSSIAYFKNIQGNNINLRVKLSIPCRISTGVWSSLEETTFSGLLPWEPEPRLVALPRNECGRVLDCSLQTLDLSSNVVHTRTCVSHWTLPSSVQWCGSFHFTQAACILESMFAFVFNSIWVCNRSVERVFFVLS